MRNRKIRSLLTFSTFLTSILLSLHTQAENPAYQVLQRAIGDINASRFEFVQKESLGEVDWFEVVVKNNRVYVTGNSPIALSKGAYTYIKNNNYGVVTWEGTNVNIPDELQDKEYPRVTSSMPLRMYINPVTYGYTMAWWTWERWEKELDWMALHGINMPVALLGQEAIWREVWQEIGIDPIQLHDYHTGPAFLPWFRMGNIYNHHGPLPQSWMEREKVLQKNILARMKQLGMRPIVPAFSGHVPPYFKQLYPNSTTYRLENWGGLESEKASILLDPKDPLFTKIGRLFLEKYEAVYGKADLFLADSFNEMVPPVSEDSKNEELAEYGEAIYKSIREYDPRATWVVQGWTFGHQSFFWNSKATQSFFSRIPKDNLLMLNYGEDRYPLWERLDAFYGFKWTYGYVHNYGGQQSLFGDINFYYDKYRDLINDSDKGNLVGYGVLPEAIENNSIVYEYIFDVPWGATDIPVTDWVNDYISNRYGKVTDNVKEAWEIAVENTYSVKEWKGVADGPLMNWLDDNVFNRYGKVTEVLKKIHGFVSKYTASEDDEKRTTIGLGYGTYIHNNRPTFTDINIDHYIGNPESIRDVLSLLLKEFPKYRDSELFYYDIVDFAQHYTAYKVDVHLVQASQHYKNNEFESGDKAFEKTKDLMKKLEQLQVVTGGSFTDWCEEAVKHATSEEERQLYLRNAKAQVTVWGGDRLKDYASKSWSGLLLSFYLPRWEMFFENYKSTNEKFNARLAQDALIEWEENWIRQLEIPASPKALTKTQNINLIKQLIANY
ncbi:alpha-N-acetylglucosaminidase [Exilibacterium tricleocarpae]|uniref:Alpha-N-acetylglucosaminidase n=1 Tax=Exilibacterium tricleocarpae TaxID=2591008 RepID=A0A545TZF5_9GAMM|nr:alpha-N-acetylglucosaminidase [Exilibacterium tricleocarpae]TQV82591.1 alpha-N-acetylglucosaminidase [Exilibacterium tricleocarpae]